MKSKIYISQCPVHQNIHINSILYKYSLIWNQSINIIYRPCEEAYQPSTIFHFSSSIFILSFICFLGVIIALPLSFWGQHYRHWLGPRCNLVSQTPTGTLQPPPHTGGDSGASRLENTDTDSTSLSGHWWRAGHCWGSTQVALHSPPHLPLPNNQSTKRTEAEVPDHEI